MDWVTHPISTGDHFINDTLSDIPELGPASKTRWQPLESSSSLFQLGTSVSEPQGRPLMTLRPQYLTLDEKKEPLPELSDISESTSSSAAEEWGSVQEFGGNSKDLVDVWSSEEVIHPLRAKQLLSWDSFRNPLESNIGPVYLGESGLKAFDAALKAEATRRGSQRPNTTVSREDFLESLVETAIGRDSLLYHYDSKTARFIPTCSDYRLSGISTDVQESLLHDVVTMGTCMRNLESFMVNAGSQPLMVALASAVSSILYATKIKMDELKLEILTPLQLQHLFSRSKSLLHSLETLIHVISIEQRNPKAIFRLIEKAEELCSSECWLGPLLHAILQRSSVPYLVSIGKKVGLGNGGPYNVEILATSAEDAGLEGEATEPSAFLPGPFQDLISECEQCLNICCREQIANSVLNHTESKTIRLAWQSSWTQVLKSQNDAVKHETAIRKRVLNGTDTVAREQPATVEDTTGCSLEDALFDIDAKQLTGHHLAEAPGAEPSPVFDLVMAALDPDCETQNSLSLSPHPPISQTLSLSVRPLLIAHSRLLSFYTLRVLLKNHALRTHLTTLYRFQLMADGSFASRLSQALFDGDLSSSDGRRIGEGTTGLRLQARDTWPPASSELRLALMGILTESYHTETSSSGSDKDDLPGSLSFAIRELSIEEVDCCRDPNHIGALDFLRMQYKPTTELGHIITDRCLQKYDSIFRFMLRLLRLRAVTQSLLRDVTSKNSLIDLTTQSLRIQMHHFINSLVAYIYHDAIEASWTRFQQLLAKVEDGIDDQDYEGTLLRAQGLSWLQKLHESVLDHILFGLFLGEEQSEAMRTICAIFGLILRFSSEVGKDSHQHTGNLKALHQDLTVQVKGFVRHLRSQKPSKAKAVSGWTDSDSVLGGRAAHDTLLVKLDICGYYS